MSALWENLQTAATAKADTHPVIIPLTNEALLTVQGADAHKFLQGQCSTDITQVTANSSRLGCLCNLKGRAIVSFRAVQWQEQTIHLVMDAPLVAVAKPLLQKYIVFSKAQLSTPDMAIFGIIGVGASDLISKIFGSCPTETDSVFSNDQVSITRLHGEQRFLILTTADTMTTLWPQLTQQAAIGDVNAWRLAQIAAGEAQVLASTSELFQPQELNLPTLNGVSYNKGCYTGQEVVARLYFRGKLKQFVHRFQAAGTVLPALNAAISDDTNHTQGHVVLAAQRDSSTIEMLAIARRGHLEGLHIAESNQALTLLDLPYVVEVKE
jgi:folate-binding protein YgfZ